MENTPVSFQLTQEDIIRYREQISNTLLSMEKEVLKKIPGKLQELMRVKIYSTFIVDLIRDVERLYILLTEVNHITDDVERMIIFALSYFIKEKDEIPDSIDILGYLDDAVLVRWVVDEIKKEHPEYFTKQ
ncbi:MAG: DUF1232 domain-containing protein [Candidatus Marinimicrobia bacterium]|nr:DUF1232 domain-containing protein [Candidatus Neomarinimicrobiota bacterium]MBL7047160.1 DUF1232 domain-containing protein [Candidatus Neomarinimicrobiota bacterium]